MQNNSRGGFIKGMGRFVRLLIWKTNQHATLLDKYGEKIDNQTDSISLPCNAQRQGLEW